MVDDVANETAGLAKAQDEYGNQITTTKYLYGNENVLRSTLASYTQLERGIGNLSGVMLMVGLAGMNDEMKKVQHILIGVHGALQMMIVIKTIAGIRKDYETIKASIETAAHAAAQNWGAIALATGTAAAVTIALTYADGNIDIGDLGLAGTQQQISAGMAGLM